jgi:predicted RNA binding protein YcfA (HicA-like mRNA interferase family)
MPKVMLLNYRLMHKVLLKLNFKKIRQKGSHVFYRHDDGRTTTVPNHKGQDLAKPLIRAILSDIEISVNELVEIVNNL